MGFTFVVKTMQKKESLAQVGYEQMQNELKKLLSFTKRNENDSDI